MESTFEDPRLQLADALQVGVNEASRLASWR